MELNIYSSRQKWKLLILTFGIIIIISSLWVTNSLVKDLANEERKKAELWAEATKHLGNPDYSSEKDLQFLFKIIQNNTTVPVILVDDSSNIGSYRNLNFDEDITSELLKIKLNTELDKMKRGNPPIVINLLEGENNYIYYKDSLILTRLSFYPYIQLFIIAIFIFIAYYAFSSTRKAEQNQVWLGMSKETAHQLGTPTSSLLAWVELLKDENLDNNVINELEKDVVRLEKITERFSKIGSIPKLDYINLIPVFKNGIEYIKKRTSEKVKFKTSFHEEDEYTVPINLTLFEWVIENLFKNAINAMNGAGELEIKFIDNTQFVFIDISDTGKGIPKNMHKTVFQPGYTTRQRGWGLGLSLSKRIIEIYHKGKIFVHQSELNEGTTFRIVLKKSL